MVEGKRVVFEFVGGKGRKLVGIAKSVSGRGRVIVSVSVSVSAEAVRIAVGEQRQRRRSLAAALGPLVQLRGRQSLAFYAGTARAANSFPASFSLAVAQLHPHFLSLSCSTQEEKAGDKTREKRIIVLFAQPPDHDLPGACGLRSG